MTLRELLRGHRRRPLDGGGLRRRRARSCCAARPDHLTAILASTVLVFATRSSPSASTRRPSSRWSWPASWSAARRARARAVARPRAAGLLGDRGLRHQRPRCSCSSACRSTRDMLVAEAWSIAIALVALHAGRAVAVYGCFGGAARAHPRGRGPDALAARDGVRQHQGRALDGRRARAARRAPLSRAARHHRLRRHLRHAADAGAAVSGSFRRGSKVTLGSDDATLDGAKATLIAARRGQAELDQLLLAGLVSRKGHAERRAAFQRAVIRADATLRASTPAAPTHASTPRSSSPKRRRYLTRSTAGSSPRRRRPKRSTSSIAASST